MKDEQKLDLVLERFYNRFNKYNTKVLKELGNVIKQFDGLDTEQAHMLAQELKFSNNIDKLTEELARLSGKSVQDMEIFFEKVAEENLEFSEALKMDYNDQIKKFVQSIQDETKDTFRNLSNTKSIGFTFKDGHNNIIFKPLKDVYIDVIDEAVYNVSRGVLDYQDAMNRTINQLADSGVKIHEDKVGYKSGYNRRIDSSVRQSILTGVRKINLGIQDRVGQEFGADGFEISAHFPCADDHLDIQGRQYTKEEYKELNEELIRPIGELNCTHFAFAIIMGVNLPSYTEEQLEEMKRNSLEEITYNGKTYTKYEATQVQRRLETEIRRQKDRQIIAKESGNTEKVQKIEKRISQLTSQYTKFSRIADIPTKMNRLQVVGYKK